MQSADKVIAITDRAMETINDRIREELSSFTDEELKQYGDQLTAEPYANLLHLLVTRPKDTAMMVAVHYYQEYFRRVQVKAMEANDV